LAACASQPEAPLDGLSDSFFVAGKADLGASIEEGSPEANAVLRVANALSEGDLHDQVGLDMRVASYIVAARPLDSLMALDDVPYVGPRVFRKLLAYARAQGFVCPGESCSDSSVSAQPAPVPDTLEARTLAMDASNLRAHKFFQRLREGYTFDDVQSSLRCELNLIDEDVGALERTGYESQPERVDFMKKLLHTKDMLTELQSILPDLAQRPEWTQWFPPASICHDIQVSETTTVTTIRGILDVYLASVSWESLGGEERQGVIDGISASAQQTFPQRAAEVDAAMSHEGIRQGLIASASAAEIHARLSFVLQVVVSVMVTTISCPGDDRVIERDFGGQDYGQTYTYGLIPSKDIIIYRRVARYGENPATVRYRRSDYHFSFQGVDVDNVSGTLLLAGPCNTPEQILEVREDGTVVKGPKYGYFFTSFGVEVPDAIPPAQVPSVVHAIDSYLAGEIESFELAVHFYVVLSVEFSFSATVR
jgi:hypothetical protein